MHAKPPASRHFAFITDEIPRPGEAGHLAVNHAIISWLTRHGHYITVLLARPRLPWPIQGYGTFFDTRAVRIEGPGLLAQPGRVLAPRAAPRILARQALSLLPASLRERLRGAARTGEYGAVDTVLGQFISPQAADWCAGRIAQLRPDAILIDTIFRAPVLRDARLEKCNSVVVAHDVFHLRHAALSARGYRLYPPQLSQADEVALLSLSHTIAAMQPEEADLLARLLPDRHVFANPMPASPVPRPMHQPRQPDRLVFVGSATLPNVDGIVWFLTEVWPLIRTRRPACTLDICGTVADALRSQIAPPPQGVTLLGRVPDLAPILHRASLAIAPLLAGSGLKIKLLDFVAHGLGVITTRIGADGFTKSPHRPFLIADSAESFAVRVTDTLASSATLEQLEIDALRYVQHYDADHVFTDLALALGISSPSTSVL